MAKQISRVNSLCTLVRGLAGFAAASSAMAISGCGMLSSSGAKTSTTASSNAGATPAQNSPDSPATSGGQAGGSTASSAGMQNDASTMQGADLASSAGTGAWINPQARQEPGEDNAPATFNLQQITFAQEGADFDPAISRDGQKVVFASTQYRPTADLYVKSVSGRTITQLTSDPAEDGTPDISPDGTKVAFASNRDGNWDIFVMPITGGKAIQITSDESDEIHPSWSADGSNLVFSRMGPTSGRWEMWVTDASKAGNATFIGYGLFPRFCPASGTGADGADRIVFQLGRERGQRSFAIWTIDYRDGQSYSPTLIASSPTAAFINPTWSPDGKFIVYSSVPAGDAWGRAGGPPAAELWLASVTAEASVRLTSGDLRALRPAWGPSNRLYFVSSRNATENIWSIDLAQSLASVGGTPEKGMTTAANSGRPAPRTSGKGAPQVSQAKTQPTTPRATTKPASAEEDDSRSSQTTADAGQDNQ